MMMPEDQQSYIRSMSLCTLKKFKVNRGLQIRSCWESPSKNINHSWMGEKGPLLWSKTGAPKVEDRLSSDARIYTLPVGNSGTSGSPLPVLARMSEPLREQNKFISHEEFVRSYLI
ncbi:hypothetical protein AVEN_262233-1 [Araneus ventricosus]|uniref:Uncharacterized protein n=1 Tax=Araneus ventricosus TaxID=182803 RepID=A0A4Y2GGY1_ARAVE|nr:hypothetical protein AVEN_262233-1 [Araneus ventricosus]